MNLLGAPIAHEGFFATHFFTVSDQDKSKDFYVRILGGKVIKPENPCYIKLANTWIILNSGSGPTPDKPEVLLETPSDLTRVNSFLNLRVADIWACYKQWSDKERSFLPSRWTITAGSGAATCVIPTDTSSRSANILKRLSTVSKTTPVNCQSNFTPNPAEPEPKPGSWTFSKTPQNQHKHWSNHHPRKMSCQKQQRSVYRGTNDPSIRSQCLVGRITRHLEFAHRPLSDKPVSPQLSVGRRSTN